MSLLGNCTFAWLCKKHNVPLSAEYFKDGDIEIFKGQKGYIRCGGAASIIEQLLFKIEYGFPIGSQGLVDVNDVVVSHNCDGVNPPNEKS
jgi:hypothetical protein